MAWFGFVASLVTPVLMLSLLVAGRILARRSRLQPDRVAVHRSSSPCWRGRVPGT